MKTLKAAGQTLIALLLVAISAPVLAQGDLDLENEDVRISYALGVNVGQSLAAQGLTAGVDIDVFVAGMLDSVAGNAQIDEAQMMAALQTFMQRQADAAAAASNEALAASEAFLTENGQRAGVVTLESGLQYEIIESGPAGGESPALSNSVVAHYHGTLTDGTVFDSSVERGTPATFGVSQVIAGWTEALQIMKVGDKWRLFIPPGMAYGESSPTPAIPPNSALIFEVEMLEIM